MGPTSQVTHTCVCVSGKCLTFAVTVLGDCLRWLRGLQLGVPGKPEDRIAGPPRGVEPLWSLL